MDFLCNRPSLDRRAVESFTHLTDELLVEALGLQPIPPISISPPAHSSSPGAGPARGVWGAFQSPFGLLPDPTNTAFTMIYLLFLKIY